MEAAEEAAEQRRQLGPSRYLGLMQQGQEDNLIRDNQVVHLAQVREQEMAEEMANQISEIIEEQLRGFRNPDQLTEPLRDTIHLQRYRLDADDEHQNVPVHQMNDSSSDSGGSVKSETHPEICWEAHEWIKSTDPMVGADAAKLTMLDLAGFRCRQHACKHGATGLSDCHSCNAFTHILVGYGFEPEKFGMKCDLHPQQDNQSCQICATHLAMGEVDIREAITIEKAPLAPFTKSLP